MKKHLLWLIATVLINTLITAQPTINSFTPLSAPIGANVTITGNNFSAIIANNIVFFGSTRATVTSASSTMLTVNVPAGAIYQPISVTVNGLTGYSSKPFLVTYSGGMDLNPGTFSESSDSVTGLYPYGIVFSDLDGDGKTDLATPNNANSPSSSISILRNTGTAGTISFASKIDFPSNDLPMCIAVCDLDGDGKQDLLTTNNSNRTVSAFKNISTPGSISFATKVDFSTGTNPYNVATGDFDNDGRPDLAVTNYLSNTISVFLNTSTPGTISFAPKIDLSTALNPRGIAVTDFDGDGKVDIGITNQLSNSFSIFRNTTSSTGNLTFATRTDISCGNGNEPRSMVTGDFDVDGKMDLAVIINNSNGSGAQIFKNNSSVGVISFTISPVASNPNYSTCYEGAIHDINGDGKPDLALTLSNPNGIRIFQNNSTSNITFRPGVHFYSQSPYSVGLGDLDGDGKPDMAASNFIWDRVSTFRNTISRPVISSFSPTAATSGTTVRITGVNFTGVNSVKFGGVPAASFTIINSTTIDAVIADGSSGDVSVTNSYGTGSLSDFSYLLPPPPPTITSFTPTSGTLNTVVTIYGQNFSGCNQVLFGGTPAAAFVVVSPTQIRAQVAAGSSGAIIVSTPSGSSTSPGFTYFPPLLSDLPTSVSKNILCKAETVVVTIQNTEQNVKYELLDSLDVSYGSVNSNGGTISFVTIPISRTGNYRIRATRLNFNATTTFTDRVFILVEHTRSDFVTNILNILPNEAVHFYQRSVDAQHYSWSFTADASIHTAGEPTVQNVWFTIPGQKNIRLISSSANGCKDTLEKNAVVVYTKPSPDDNCFVGLLGSTITTYPRQPVYLSSTHDNGFVVTGRADQPGALSSRYGIGMPYSQNSTNYVARYTTDGVLRWALAFNDNQGSFASTAMDANGNIYIVGRAVSTTFLKLNNNDSIRFAAVPSDTTYLGTKNNGFILKLDPNGNYLWHSIIFDHTANYSGYPHSMANPLKLVVKNNYLLLMGDFASNLAYVNNGVISYLYSLQPSTAPNERQNKFILKIGTDGILKWETCVLNQNSSDLTLSDVDADTFGNVYISGFYRFGYRFFDADSVQQINIALIGGSSRTRSYLLKLDGNGKLKWYNDQYTGQQSNAIMSQKMVVDPIGNVYLTSGMRSSFYLDEIITVNNNGTIYTDSLGGYTLYKYDSSGKRVWAVGLKQSPFGNGEAIYLKDNSVYTAGSVFFNDNPLSFLFTSSNRQHQNIKLSSTEFFIAHYDTSGLLNRVIKSGPNFNTYATPHALHMDSFNNFIIGCNLEPRGSTSMNLFSIPVSIPSSQPSARTGAFIKLNPSYCYSSSAVPVADAGPDRMKCPGDTTRIGVPPTAGNTYYWYNNTSNFSSTLANPVVSVHTTTQYYLTVVNEIGLVSRDTVIVQVSAGAAANAGNDQTICWGSSATIGTPSATEYTYSWTSAPEGFVSSTANPTVTPSATTRYFLTATNTTTGCVSRDTVTISVTQTVTPSVTITGPSSICSGSNAVFTAAANNGGTTPHFQWSVNGVNAGPNSNTFNTNSLSNNSQVSVILTSTLSCVTAPTVTSNVIAVTVNPSGPPSVSISTASSAICQGSTASFSASVTNGGSSPSYQWKRNGLNVGTNSPNYSANNFTDGDAISVVLTTFSACISPSTATSNTITLSVKPIVVPSIVISGNTTVVSGASSVISTVVTNGGGTPAYQWQDSTETHNWSDITGGTLVTLDYSPPHTGSKLRCVLKSSDACAIPTQVLSNALAFSVNTTGRVLIYPNPTREYLTIDQLDPNDKWQMLVIATPDGKENILHKNISGLNKTTIDIRHLAPGLHLIVLKSTNSTKIIKFIKL